MWMSFPGFANKDKDDVKIKVEIFDNFRWLNWAWLGNSCIPDNPFSRFRTVKRLPFSSIKCVSLYLKHSVETKKYLRKTRPVWMKSMNQEIDRPLWTSPNWVSPDSISIDKAFWIGPKKWSVIFVQPGFQFSIDTKILCFLEIKILNVSRDFL